MEKYTGWTVGIIYLAQNGRLTQRLEQIRKVQGLSVWALCMSSKGLRTFRADAFKIPGTLSDDDAALVK